ncbi:ABC transporter ATP-binding protein [Planomonospora parontospora]|uniref:ABC transporter ATP-binding protein n=1 Tax=Planomonospora parontospora TaxID=58119 RepID=UPI001670C2A6|nr:ABC transporter ATP-binding protein [Planomonospora parontospora]GGL59384.1 ABC transporter [Planomonospora parontospora subsp. antibiotica]GII19235.1 ABC transporter [Planomonospora parontospora subsp. antibiotica]
MTDVVRLDAVSKVYGTGQGAVAALREVTVGIPQGSFTAVMGPSGSGKSTFLHCAAGLDAPSSGSVRLGGTELTGMDETRLTKLRRRRIGFVFQAFNLVSSLTAAENITLPLRLSGDRVDRAWLREIVSRVGLDGRTGHRPAQLSGGQQQRVAIARALAIRPEVVFGDEPTGALDTMTARDVLRLLREVVDGMGQTVVMVTHDPVAASYADTVLFLADGRIVDAMTAPTSDRVAERMTRLGAWV